MMCYFCGHPYGDHVPNGCSHVGQSCDCAGFYRPVYYEDPLVTLLLGDCIEVMATLPADSVDAVVTDPPYGLEFMGKEWDRFGAGLEQFTDADYGSKDGNSFGQPSGRHVRYGKPGREFQAWCEQWGREALRVTKPGGYLLSFGGTRTHHRLVCALEDAGWIIRDELDWIYASGFPKGKANLKPAHEPIVLARKPGPLRPLAIDECRIGTEQQYSRRSEGEDGSSFPRFGKPPGVYPADAPGRWPSNVLLSDPELFDQPNPYVVGSGATAPGSGESGSFKRVMTSKGLPGGGFGQEKSVDRDPIDQKKVGYGDSGGYSRFFIVPKADRGERERGLAERPKETVPFNGHSDHSAGLAPGSVEAKMTTSPRANVHPTVKPIDLMRHLVRLVTPSGGTVLDPFLGSGTTCLAASEEGLRSIGIERELEYLDIAKGRLMATPMGLGLSVDPMPEEVA